MNGDFHLTKSSGLHFRKFSMGNGKVFSKIASRGKSKFRKFLNENFRSILKYPEFSVKRFIFPNITIFENLLRKLPYHLPSFRNNFWFNG